MNFNGIVEVLQEKKGKLEEKRMDRLNNVCDFYAMPGESVNAAIPGSKPGLMERFYAACINGAEKIKYAQAIIKDANEEAYFMEKENS
ncbi:MAG: hypothetical protein ACP5N2_00070 [Candidatus Nanoarchaeia archaeon]